MCWGMGGAWRREGPVNKSEKQLREFRSILGEHQNQEAISGHWFWQWFFFGFDMESTRNISKGNQGGLYQTKKFLYSKGTINMKRQPIKWEKIFANPIAYKRLIAKIYKELIQLNSKKPNKPPPQKIKNGQRTWIDIFPKKTNKWPTGM